MAGRPEARAERHLLRGHRPPEQEALPERAPPGDQELELIDRLDALGDRAHPQPIRELQHRRDQRRGAGVVRQAHDARAIDLQDLAREVARRLNDEYPAPKSSIAR